MWVFGLALSYHCSIRASKGLASRARCLSLEAGVLLGYQNFRLSVGVSSPPVVAIPVRSPPLDPPLGFFFDFRSLNFTDDFAEALCFAEAMLFLGFGFLFGGPLLDSRSGVRRTRTAESFVC